MKIPSAPAKDDGADMGPSKSAAYKEEVADDIFDSSISFLEESEEEKDEESEDEKDESAKTSEEKSAELSEEKPEEKSEEKSEEKLAEDLENKTDSNMPQENTKSTNKKKPQKSLFDF